MSATVWRERGRRWGAVWRTWRRRGGRAKRSSAPAKVRLFSSPEVPGGLCDWRLSVVLRPQAAGLVGSLFEAQGGGVSGRGASQGRGGATADGGEGKSEEGGVGAFHAGNHTGQQPPGHANGQWKGHRGQEVDHETITVRAVCFTLSRLLCPFYPQPKAATLPAAQTSSSSSLSSSSSQPYNSNVGADPVNSASALKSRPASIMATKGKVLQKAMVSLKSTDTLQWNKTRQLHTHTHTHTHTHVYYIRYNYYSIYFMLAEYLNTFFFCMNRSGRRNPPPRGETWMPFDLSNPQMFLGNRNRRVPRADTTFSLSLIASLPRR